MFPLRDINPSRNKPVATYTLITLNVVCYVIQMSYGANVDQFNFYYGLVPARFTLSEYSFYFSFFENISTFFTYMFLHGSLWHLLGNMWFLYIFGDNVEDTLGTFRYLTFYVLCGVLSGLAHFMFNMTSNMPTIGASGAISGVMGAYLVLFPRSKILTLFPIFIIPLFFQIPAFIFLGIWLFFQIISAISSHGDFTSVAWWAHIGGFLTGAVLIKMMKTIPSAGISEKITKYTEKKTTEGFQLIQPKSISIDDPNLYAMLTLTPFEAARGTRKLINIPWGFYKRLYRVTIPPGSSEGQQLRLAGMGKEMVNGQKGDLYLRIAFRQY